MSRKPSTPPKTTARTTPKTTPKATTKTTTKTPRRQGRPPKEDAQGLRDKIMAATRELLRTRPPDVISRIDIARAANVDPALIRYYFGSKDDVLSAVALTFMNEFMTSSFETPASGEIQDLVRLMLGFTMTMIERFPFMHDLLVREIGRVGISRGARIRNAFIDSPSVRTANAIRSTNSIPLDARQLQFFRMMIIAMAVFPLRERGFVEQIFGRDHFDAELTRDYCDFVAQIFAQGMQARPAG